MAKIGLTLSSEEHPPARLVEIAVAAEEAGFDFVSISDHFHPWLNEQGHSPFVWSVLGAIANATSDIEVGVGVTCPIVRIHPVINAQAVATTASLLPGRFTWGVGTGEALNEHVLGDPWPPAPVRLEMLEEAIDLIRELWKGESVTYNGRYFAAENARIYDLPEQDPPILVSAFGKQSAELAARAGDGLWTTGVPREVLDAYREAGGEGDVWTQLTFCWDPDTDVARERAVRVWANSGVPGQLSQDLPTVEHFELATQLITVDKLEESMPVGPDPEPILSSVEDARRAGIEYVYLHQVGNPLDGFIEFWTENLKPKLS